MTRLFSARHGGRAVKWSVTAVVCGLTASLIVIYTATLNSLRPFPDTLNLSADNPALQNFLDRRGRSLSVAFNDERNVSDQIALHRIPSFLRHAFVASEDRRFFSHSGVDWLARGHAFWQNLRALAPVRGGSTISEQVVRILHPRPRNIWSRWVEGVEARRLERHFSKAEILEFYLNQVPYARRRRGVQQAARLYFDRDLDTLNRREALALVTLVRAPTLLDPLRNLGHAERSVDALIDRLEARRELSAGDARESRDQKLELAVAAPSIEAAHFVRTIRTHDVPLMKSGEVRTTLDGDLQSWISGMLEGRIRELAARNVRDGAALVIDHRANEVRAWVNAGPFFSGEDGSQIDAILTPRQPGSALKPFVYALALERGWNPATVIDDAPLAQPVGNGIHNFRNYSRIFYGPVRLREALGNSLNIPAVKAVEFVGENALLDLLHAAGFESLSRSADYYGEGLALGNGEVSLFELTRAYAAFARGGILLEPRFFSDQGRRSGARRIFSAETSALIGDILADPHARRREFGAGGIMRFPKQTAVKTGTSSDYRDVWAVGFSDRFTVGVWMGNLTREPMREVTGAIGPALLLRAIFAKLESGAPGEPLALPHGLISRRVCSVSGIAAGPGCPAIDEWFVRGKEPRQSCNHRHEAGAAENLTGIGVTDHHAGIAGRIDQAGDAGQRRMRPRIAMPTPGLQIAMDPRIPDDREAIRFQLAGVQNMQPVEWIVDGQRVGAGDSRSGAENQPLWQLRPGVHEVRARLEIGDGTTVDSEPVRFYVR